MNRKDLIDAVTPYTVLDRPRLESLYDLASTALALPGCFVECGCGRGGSAGVLAGVLQSQPNPKRLYVCDTFEGLPPPDLDVDHAEGWSREVVATIAGTSKGTVAQITGICQLAGRSVPVTCRQGLYRDTLPSLDCGPIALLHADADWYYSTRQILEALWPNIVPGGVLIFDDYHFWSGCKQAVDEFFEHAARAMEWRTVSCAVWGRK
jgi:hypothetical protein